MGPVIGERGYRVLALDLPGHGHSPADPTLTIDTAVASIADTVDSMAGGSIDLAVGHSYGGMLLAAGLHALAPARTVIVDAPLSIPGGADVAETCAGYARDASARTAERLRRERPWGSEVDVLAEARAAEQFDPATSAAISAGDGGTWRIPAGSVVIRPTESAWMPPKAALERDGAIVHCIDGAAHTVWYSHFDEFMAALPLE